MQMTEDLIRSVVEEQNPDPARRAEFDRLHKLSVMLNVGVMVLNLTALLTTATALTRMRSPLASSARLSTSRSTADLEAA